MYCRADKRTFSIRGCFEVVISIIIGAIVGILFAFFLIPNIFAFILAAFGLAVLALIFLLAGVFLAAVKPPNALSKCLHMSIDCLLVSIFGTILSALAALCVVLIPLNIAAIAIVAITAFFFTLMVIKLIAFIRCIVHWTKCYHEDDQSTKKQCTPPDDQTKVCIDIR